MPPVELLLKDNISIPTNTFDVFILKGVTVSSSFLEESLNVKEVNMALKFNSGFIIPSSLFYKYNSIDILNDLQEYSPSDEETDRPSCALCGYETFKVKNMVKYSYNHGLSDNRQRLLNAVNETTGHITYLDIPICIHCIEELQEKLYEYSSTIETKLVASEI